MRGRWWILGNFFKYFTHLLTGYFPNSNDWHTYIYHAFQNKSNAFRRNLVPKGLKFYRDIYFFEKNTSHCLVVINFTVHKDGALYPKHQWILSAVSREETANVHTLKGPMAIRTRYTTRNIKMSQPATHTN